MAKSRKPHSTLLRWSEYVRVSDALDPLGLNLRGSTRLASQLLHGITSITPRARYFSFLPWCIQDYQTREAGKPFARDLADAVAVRERALTLACVLHHDGKPCSGGGVVGSEKATKWVGEGKKVADLRAIPPFAKVPARRIYINSLRSLGLVDSQSEFDEHEEEIDEGEEAVDQPFGEVVLTPLGLELAGHLDSIIRDLPVVRMLAAARKTCSITDLADLGSRAGLCELAEDATPERQLLRDIFFRRIDMDSEAHRFRRMSLLLVLELSQQAETIGCELNQWTFADAVYFAEFLGGDGSLPVVLPTCLDDIALRWRMFYFHHYMSVALESLFSWVVTQLQDRGLAGATTEEIAIRTDDPKVGSDLTEVLSLALTDDLSRLSPLEFMKLAGVSDGDLSADRSKESDSLIRCDSLLAESRLEGILREQSYQRSSTGLALPLIMLVVTLARFERWRGTKVGNWLTRAAKNPNLDLIPPVLVGGLNQRLGNWYTSPLKNLIRIVLSRFVIEQHRSVSFEKSPWGDRCIIDVDGQVIRTVKNYDEIGMGNPRLRSAIQILKDLNLLSDTEKGKNVLTRDGRRFLKQELSQEGAP